jgi:hypothetical protein
VEEQPRQKQLMAQADEARFGRLYHGLGEADKRRLLSVSARKTAGFITAVPNSHQLMPTTVYAAALRLRLGMRQFPTTEYWPCPATKADGDTICGELSESTGQHALKCGTGNGRTSRHNSIRDVLIAILTTARFTIHKEPLHLLDDGSRPADAAAEGWEGPKMGVFDVTVVTPQSGQGINRGGLRRAQAADAAEQAKMLKYAEACADKGYVFAPVAVEVFGAWGKRAQKVLARLGYALAERSGRPRALEVRHMYERLSVALQTRNARMILARAPPE